MENDNASTEIQVELTDEIAQGNYANLAVVAFSSSEFVLDFIRGMPGITKAKVQDRVILTPENTKRLLLLLQDNLIRYEKQYGKITDGLDQGFLPPMGPIKGEA